MLDGQNYMNELYSQKEYIPFQDYEIMEQSSQKCQLCRVNINVPCKNHFNSNCPYSCNYNSVPIGSESVLLCFLVVYVIVKRLFR